MRVSVVGCGYLGAVHAPCMAIHGHEVVGLEIDSRKAEALLLTEWSAYTELDPTELRSVVAAPRVLDGRTALDPTVRRAAGWTYRALGRP